MKVTDIFEMAKMTKTELGYGLTQYSNANFILAGGMRSGSSSADTTRLKYVIYDMSLFKKKGDEDKSQIGIVELFVEDETGEIVGLVNIELKPKFRKGGRGRQIIQDIKDTTKSGFTVHDIQKKARKFWEKVGIDYDSKMKRGGRINK